MNTRARVLLPLLLALAVVSTAQVDPAREGYDPMRQIAVQLLNPNMMIVFDQSGSLTFPMVQPARFRYTSNGYADYTSWWGFGFSVQELSYAYANIMADYTENRTAAPPSGAPDTAYHPRNGTGHGYWMRAWRQTAALNKRGAVVANQGGYLYVQNDQGWVPGDVVTVTGLPNASQNGTYMIVTTPAAVSFPRGYYRFRVIRRNATRTWQTAPFTFTVPGSGTAAITLERPSQSRWYFVPPCRMAILKNALGNSITIYDKDLPDGTEEFTDHGGQTYAQFDDDGGPTAGAYYNFQTRAWVSWTPTTREPAPAMTIVKPPTDLIGTTAASVNWGLVTYQDVGSGCSTQTLRANVSTTDNETQVAAIEGFLGTTASGGLRPSGGTPTRAGLQRAIANDALPSTHASDPKRTCGRPYAVILVTDGESNTCNPDGDSWDDCAGNARNNYDDYPAGVAEDLWNSGAIPQLRTFVIGVSDAVGRCELNYTAFRGRSDKSAPNGDAGYELDGASRPIDPYLPQSDADWTKYCVGTCTDGTTHGDYAFFSNTTEELKDAFGSIIAAIGVGDYTTASPTIASSQVSDGSVSYLGSASYPSWKGHLYAYALTPDCPDDVSVTTDWDCRPVRPCGWSDPDSGQRSNCLWDAGEVLSVGGLTADGVTRKAPNNGNPRRVYTWVPATRELIRVESTDAAVTAVNAACGNCLGPLATAKKIVQFTLGEPIDLDDNASTPAVARPWKLGAVVNSTTAVTGPAEVWRNLTDHTTFESTYAGRHRIVWVGASDGMMHGFDSIDGSEMVAILPPDMLAKQAQLFAGFARNPAHNPTGEPRFINDHIYGMANSPRYADVKVADDYKTILFTTEGKGGRALHAIEVTNPFPGNDYDGDGTFDGAHEGPDANYGSGPGIGVLWARTGPVPNPLYPVLSNLGETWSIPTLGVDESQTDWQLFFGSGFFPYANSTTAPSVYRVNPVNGNVREEEQLTQRNASALVHNQSFADTVTWETSARVFAPDNEVNQGVQVDLNGQFWTFDADTWEAEVLFDVGAGQPLYYPPAAAAFPVTLSPAFSLYAFSSGTFYEKSPAVFGADTGLSGHFVPTLFVSFKNRVTDETAFEALPLTDMPKPGGGTLGRRTIPSAPPVLLVPAPGASGKPFAVFLVFDPDASTCIGRSYAIKVEFDPDDLAATVVPVENVWDAGAGAAAGFAIAGGKVFVSRSAVGAGGRAVVQPLQDDLGGATGPRGDVNWWRELQ